MVLALAHDTFTEIPVTGGTIQNINEYATVEIGLSGTSGLILYPHQKLKWEDSTIYARAGWDIEGVKVAVI